MFAMITARGEASCFSAVHWRDIDVTNISKGIVSAIVDDGNKVAVKPYIGEIVTFDLVVPFFLVGCLKVGTPVVYTTFDDNTGIVISRMDGDWNGTLTNIEIERILKS